MLAHADRRRLWFNGGFARRPGRVGCLFPQPADRLFRAARESTMHTPDDLKYTATHEWVRRAADGSLLVGITDHAQDLLGDLVFVQLPEVGAQLDAGQNCCVLESVKTAADVHAPLAGRVLAINAEAAAAPESINQDAYATWLFALAPQTPEAIDALLDAATYRAGLDAA
jgi:glycine cleavage system H protein